MKHSFFFALTFCALALFSCKKDDDSSGAGTTTGTAATLKASNYGFDGGSSGAFSSTAAGIVKVSAGGLTTFTISGIRDNGKESISIVILKNITAVGKIALSPQLSNGGIVIRKDYTNVTDQTMSYSTDNSGATQAGGGEVNITAYDGTNIEGTFSATCYNSARKDGFVEQGTFKGKIN